MLVLRSFQDGLRIAGEKFIWFEVKSLILHLEYGPLNRQDSSSSPCAPTNDFKRLYNRISGCCYAIGRVNLFPGVTDLKIQTGRGISRPSPDAFRFANAG
jgi:hypothetical protein